MQNHFRCIQLFETLWTVACQASLSGGFSRQEYWSWLPYPSRAPYFLLPLLPTPLSTLCCQGPWVPRSCTTLTPGTHWRRHKSSRAASGANPCGWSSCRDGSSTGVWMNHNWNPGALWLRKKTQNLPTSCISYRLNPHDQLGRLLFPLQLIFNIYKSLSTSI